MSVDSSHDDLSIHDPMTYVTRQRWLMARDWRERFRENVAHYSQPCPPNYDVSLWQALRDAAQAQVDNLTAQMKVLELALGEIPSVKGKDEGALDAPQTVHVEEKQDAAHGHSDAG